MNNPKQKYTIYRDNDLICLWRGHWLRDATKDLRHCAGTRRSSLLASTVHGRTQGSHFRQSWFPARFDQPYGTAKFINANGNAPVHTTDKCIQQESRKSRTHDCDLLHALQFLPDSPEFARDTSNGGRNHRSRLVAGWGCETNRIGLILKTTPFGILPNWKNNHGIRTSIHYISYVKSPAYLSVSVWRV